MAEAMGLGILALIGVIVVYGVIHVIGNVFKALFSQFRKE